MAFLASSSLDGITISFSNVGWETELERHHRD